mgnify:CR=1 FL=1
MLCIRYLLSFSAIIMIFTCMYTVSNYHSDPLCSLEFQEKIRICTAVFNSEYFEKLRFSYPTIKINWVNGSCTKKSISFRTTNGIAEASKKDYEENLMSCRPGYEEENSIEFLYYLSHAYEPNQIFVFKSVIENNKKSLFLENLSTNVRFPINFNHTPQKMKVHA